MPVRPLTLQAIVARIATTCKGDGRYHHVARAADEAAAIQAHTHAMPAAFVLEPSYVAQGEPNAAGALVTTETENEVGVLTVVKNYAGRTGEQQSIEAETLRGLLFEALVGWAPEPEGRTLDLGRGSLLDFDEQVFYYLDVFKLRRRVRNS